MTDTGSGNSRARLAKCLQFPASQTSNDAAFTISDYADTEVTADQEAVYLPATGAASLSVEGTEVFSVNPSNAASDLVKLLEEGTPGRYWRYGRYHTTSRWALRTAVQY